MGSSYFNKLMVLVSDMLFRRNFKKKRKFVFDNGVRTLIFYYSKHNLSVRMYVIDSLTKEHIETVVYNQMWHKKCAEDIEKSINRILKKHDRIYF